jgi:superfamily II DNA/RNA helicase
MMSTFNDFSLDPQILRLLKEVGYEKPTPVQELAIPKAISGLDVIACAQTGTGKTGAFLLPCLHTLSQSPRQKNPQILILVPTRELAMQIAKEAEKFSKYLPQIKTVCIYGGVPYPPQKRALSKPFDILIATPGRLMDHMDKGMIHLSKIKTLILDEADRMLDMGFLEAVDFI